MCDMMMCETIGAQTIHKQRRRQRYTVHMNTAHRTRSPCIHSLHTPIYEYIHVSVYYLLLIGNGIGSAYCTRSKRRNDRFLFSDANSRRFLFIFLAIPVRTHHSHTRARRRISIHELTSHFATSTGLNMCGRMHSNRILRCNEYFSIQLFNWRKKKNANYKTKQNRTV